MDASVIISLILGSSGLALGLFNIYYAILKNSVRMKIEPTLGRSSGDIISGNDKDDYLSITVTNLSNFTIYINDMGLFKNKNESVSFDCSIHFSKRDFSYELKPHESHTFNSATYRISYEELKIYKKAFVGTTCGKVKKKSLRKLISQIKKNN